MIGEGGSNKMEIDDDSNETKLFKSATSLVVEGEGTFASDYMTEEEAQAKKGFKKKSKKDKKEKKIKKSKKSKKGDQPEDDGGEDAESTKSKRKKFARVKDDDDDDDDINNGGGIGGGEVAQQAPNLLAELEATAEGNTFSGKKRRRDDNDDGAGGGDGGDVMDVDATPSENENNRRRFDAAMAKGRQRTEELFKKQREDHEKELKGKGMVSAANDDVEDDDDAELMAALAKARRLKRLKQLNSSSSSSNSAPKIDDAIAAASKNNAVSTGVAPLSATEGGVTFETDTTSEFAKNLGVQLEQRQREEVSDASDASEQQCCQMRSTRKRKREKWP